MNLFGALRTSMATTGYENLKQFQKAEMMVAPALMTEGKSLQRRSGRDGSLTDTLSSAERAGFGIPRASLRAGWSGGRPLQRLIPRTSVAIG